MRILILAALAEEADAFLPGQGETIDCGWPVARTLSVSGHDVTVATTQIGPVSQLVATSADHQILIFRVSDRAMTLQGESECRPAS